MTHTVGPYNPDSNGWVRLYGTFQATPDVLSQPSIGFLVGRAAVASEITVDNIAFGPVNAASAGVTDCARPLQNGDAELGDHRLWWIFGQNDATSRINVTTDAYGGSSYAFRHKGARDSRTRGMLQKMDAACFSVGSKWGITAKFRYFEWMGRMSNVGKITQGQLMHAVVSDVAKW